jgi:hypothetical protein
MVGVVPSVELEIAVVRTSKPALFHLCITHDNIGLTALFDWFSVWQLVHERELYLPF